MVEIVFWILYSRFVCKNALCHTNICIFSVFMMKPIYVYNVREFDTNSLYACNAARNKLESRGLSGLIGGRTGKRTLGLAKAGGEQRGGCRGRPRSGVGRGRRGGGGDVADEDGEGPGVGAAVAERHGNRRGMTAEAGVQDRRHPERQLHRLLRLPSCRRRLRFHLGRRRRFRSCD
jgi:hypothetical protein